MAEHSISIVTSLMHNGAKAVCICGWEGAQHDTMRHAAVESAVHLDYQAKQRAVVCRSCGTRDPGELGPEEFCAVCKPMPEGQPMTPREQHIADALYLVRVQRNVFQTALEQIADPGVVTVDDLCAIAEEALKRG